MADLAENKASSGYWDTKDMCDRFKVSDRTLFRWMRLNENPLPKPKIEQRGVSRLWSIDDVVEWENGMSKENAA